MTHSPKDFSRRRVIRQVLSRAVETLVTNNIEDSSLEAELLLRHTLAIDRVQLYLSLDRKLTRQESEVFWGLVQRRLEHEPAAYIMGRREFYGLDFIVNPSVLIPRPETELLVEKAIELARTRNLTVIADVGTGCGAIAVSLALNLPQAKIYAADISLSALEIASANCRKHGVTNRITLLEGDLLDPMPEAIDLIVANLPYVRESELAMDTMLKFEPSLALNGGQDGLEEIRRLCAGAKDKLTPGGCLLLEIGLGQDRDVTAYLNRLFPSASIELTPDLSGINRVVSLLSDLRAPASQLDSSHV